MVKGKVRCIFVLDFIEICFGRLLIKVGFFVVTFKTNLKNDQVQGLVDSTIILQCKFRSYCIDFSVSRTISFE